MLPKNTRLTRRDNVSRPITIRKYPLFSLRISRSVRGLASHSKVAVQVPSRQIKTAVGRNLVKRQARTVTKELIPSLPQGLILVFVFNKEAKTATFDTIKRLITDAIHEISI
ncbi:MAG: ribonuclease P protein component [Patescibacteria group bacterium]